MDKSINIYDAENGNNVKAVEDFIKALTAMTAEQPGKDIEIKVGNIVLKAYDHAALMQGLIDAVEYFAEELK